MMQQGLFSKWSLFITSYLPLYFWLLFSNIDYHSFNLHKIFNFDFKYKTIRIVLFILILISIWKLVQLFKFDGSEGKHIPEKMEISPESDALMNYIVTYLTPLISFDMRDNKSVIMNISLFILIGLMYVGSNASYLNPVLGVFGYKIFGVTEFPHAHHIITNLSFDELETARDRRDELIRYKLGDGIYVIKRR